MSTDQMVSEFITTHEGAREAAALDAEYRLAIEWARRALPVLERNLLAEDSRGDVGRADVRRGLRAAVAELLDPTEAVQRVRKRDEETRRRMEAEYGGVPMGDGVPRL